MQKGAELTTERDSQLQAFLEQLADVRLRQSNLKAAGDALAARIRELMGTQEDATVGRLRVTCKQPRRFSQSLAQTLLAPDILKLVTESVDQISEDLAKQHLSGAAYESCREPFGLPKITITRIT